MTIVTEQFGRNLRAIRKRTGLSQEDLRWKSGLHRTHISSMELGKITPGIDTVVRLAEFFDVPVGDFFAGIGPEPQGAARHSDAEPISQAAAGERTDGR